MQAKAGPYEKQKPPQKPKTERYDIEVEFQPEKSFLRANAKVTLDAIEPTRAVEMELNRHLMIQDVTDAQGRKLEFTRSGLLGSHKLLVTLTEPVAANDSFALTFRYEGVMHRGELDYITKDGILLRDESRWYPAVDLSAFAALQVRIRVPSNEALQFFVGGRGAGIEAWVQKAEHIFSADQPVSSRTLIAIPQSFQCGPFVEGLRAIISPPNRWGIIPCLSPDWRDSSFKLAGDISYTLAFMAGLIVRPSIPLKVVVQAFPGMRGQVGYSAPGLMAISGDVARWHAYPGYAPGFLPHEIAHQWFPIEVTLKSEEDGWLAESLAEYLAWRYLQEKQAEDARHMVARAMRDALEDQPMRSIGLGLKLFGRESWDVTHRTLYERGMLVWRTLETVIDRERVDRALREYYKRHRGGPASIADFRKICEEISGRNLAWFFDYYLQGTRLPEVSLRRTQSNAPNEVTGEILVKNVPPEFQVRVEMTLHTAMGSIQHSVATNGEVTPFTVTTNEPVTRITLDPDSRILRVTEAALRNRAQREMFTQIGLIKPPLDSIDVAALRQKFLQIMAADAENLALRKQQLQFYVAVCDYLLRRFDAALTGFEQILRETSPDLMESEGYQVWAHIYRARILKARGKIREARIEAETALARETPALDSDAILFDEQGTARSALRDLLKKAARPAAKAKQP